MLVHDRLWVKVPESNTFGVYYDHAVVDELMEVFARFGFPSVLVSDNGPQFVSTEMEQF